ncbi:Aste57867_3702 [Aphanomyces stellatus]|uniref:Aste57867_3702 protein n=1 Tax=Aphanomyces stellatus TaxID=120398 RepID=A0A485KBV6_9STRA|nr:hypothetical protein As57867_003691 [Aphanomyces stellatus]VFT80856.1 Aste57867_3702 [Aphanomyces stellatus]
MMSYRLAVVAALVIVANGQADATAAALPTAGMARCWKSMGNATTSANRSAILQSAEGANCPFLLTLSPTTSTGGATVAFNWTLSFDFAQLKSARAFDPDQLYLPEYEATPTVFFLQHSHLLLCPDAAATACDPFVAASPLSPDQPDYLIANSQVSFATTSTISLPTTPGTYLVFAHITLAPGAGREANVRYDFATYSTVRVGTNNAADTNEKASPSASSTHTTAWVLGIGGGIVLVACGAAFFLRQRRLTTKARSSEYQNGPRTPADA